MKNWLKYQTGSWINGKVWDGKGFVYFDPSAVVGVEECSWSPEPTCLIYLSTGIGYGFCIKRPAAEIISEIQRMLP